MLCVQLGSALSVPLIEQVSAAGTAWLRLTIGALVFLALVRPPLRSVRRPDVAPLLGLGVASGLLTICFLAAIERIPLGTAVAVVGVPQATGQLSVQIIAAAAGLALLFPVLQHALVMLALRRMTHAAFGTLMALEPAIGLLLGLIVLSQEPSALQLAGIALVVAAGAAAERGGQRPTTTGTTPEAALAPLTTTEQT